MNIKLNFGDTHSEVVELTPAFLADDIIQQAVTHWSLPVDQNYNLVNVTKQKVIPPNAPFRFQILRKGMYFKSHPLLWRGD